MGCKINLGGEKSFVSILILLDYLFLWDSSFPSYFEKVVFQSLFYWITYSYPTGITGNGILRRKFQSLFYWITYSYSIADVDKTIDDVKVSILILLDYLFLCYQLVLLLTPTLNWFQSLFYWITYSYSF